MALDEKKDRADYNKIVDQSFIRLVANSDPIYQGRYRIRVSTKIGAFSRVSGLMHQHINAKIIHIK